jgi:hypothetical protein
VALAALQGGRFQERSQLRMRTMRQPRSLNFVAERHVCETASMFKSFNSLSAHHWTVTPGFETCRDVRNSVAFGGKADVPLTALFGSE